MGSSVLQWLWLVAGVALLVAEVATASFVILPLALGALAAAVAAFAGAGPALQLVTAAGVTVVSFLGLRPLAARIDRYQPALGAGVDRLVDAAGVVLEPVNDSEDGLVHVDGEDWRATMSGSRPLEPGDRVRVVAVRGTRVVVVPFEAPLPDGGLLPLEDPGQDRDR